MLGARWQREGEGPAQTGPGARIRLGPAPKWTPNVRQAQ